jgi:tetratricopeptide (TPR) repeat protein
MGRIEKTVFVSYRRTNFYPALAIVQDLTQHGFDVFFDFTGIASGDFESVILENIKARAHFVVLLTPSALERCSEPGDWLRREIETALELKRNIVPLMLESFDFGAPGIGNQLTGELAALKRYNGLPIVPRYFAAAMDALRNEFLNISLDAVHHPASPTAKEAAKEQQAAAASAPPVQQKQLTATEWFERGYKATDGDEKIRCYGEAIRLKPDFAEAFNNRGSEFQTKGDSDRAIEDYNEALRLKTDLAAPFYNRGYVRQMKGDLDAAIRDYDEAIRLKPDYAEAFTGRCRARFYKGNIDLAIQDCDEAIRLKSDLAEAFYNRGLARQQKADKKGAIADWQRFLDLGGGIRHRNQADVERRIRELKTSLASDSKTRKSTKDP